MLRKVLGIGALALVAVLAVAALMIWLLPGQAEARYGGPQGQGQGVAPGSAVAEPPRLNVEPVEMSVGDLSPSEVEALAMALDDEYKAWSVYDQVITDFGAVRPFVSIQRAEESHIAALVTLFDRYGLEVPVNDWTGNVPSLNTLSEACTAGVQAEIDNATLYDQLFTMVDNPDIIQVFTALQRASETKHLPAFERCAP